MASLALVVRLPTPFHTGALTGSQAGLRLFYASH